MVRKAKAKPPAGLFGGVQAVGKQAFKPRPSASLGGRALHDVAATAAAVSKGKAVPKPTVKRKASQAAGEARFARDVKAGKVRGTGGARVEGGTGHLAAASVLPLAKAAVPGLDALTGANALKMALKTAKNVPVDAADIAVGSPAAIYHTIAHPKDIPHTLLQPYKELAKDPVGFITEHPVMAALLAEPVRLPGRVAGAGLRAAGKQTLEREPASLPGTPLKKVRLKSKDAAVNAIQTRRDRGKPAPVLTDEPGVHVKGKDAKATELEQRVDEFRDKSQRYKSRVMVSAARSAERRGMAPEAATEHVHGALMGSGHAINRKFVREFGSTWKIDPDTGALFKVKRGTQGEVYPTREAAQKVADKAPFKAVVHPAGKTTFGVVPETAAARLQDHLKIGKSPAAVAVTLRKTRRGFGKTVLPFSKNFVAGTPVEGVYRAAVEGVGPTSYIRMRRTLSRMDPQARKEFLDRIIGDKATQTGHAGHALGYMGRSGGTLGHEFEATGSPVLAKTGRGLDTALEAPGFRGTRKVYEKYTNLVFRHYNATVERHLQTAFAGKAIKQMPFMDGHALGLIGRAIDDAAKGLSNTENMVAAVRKVHRDYGKYKDFTPTQRELLMHTTPFLPWYINTAKLLARMPLDHPLHSALLADIDAATEEWRKAHGYSLRGGEKIKDFLTGGPLGRWLPFAPKDTAGAIGGLVAPQILPAIANLSPGVDWKGKPIKGNKIANAALTELESLVPGVSQIDRATGVGDTYVRHVKDKTSVFNGKTLDQIKKDLVKNVDVTASFKTKTGKNSKAPTVVRSRGKGLKPLPALKPLKALPPLPPIGGAK